VSGVVVVTGSSGFIGRAVVDELFRRHRKVLAVSRSHLSRCGQLESVVVKDYAATPDLSGMILIHLAETRDIAEAEALGRSHIDTCLARVERLAAKRPMRIVYASSAVVYGDEMPHPRRSHEKTVANGFYALAKMACEQRVLDAGGVVARLANVYGPGMARKAVLSDILGQIHKSGPIIVRDAQVVRDFLWIDDAARGLVDLALGSATGIFNLGMGSGVSVAELARLALKASGQDDRQLIETSPSGRTSTLVLDIEDTSTMFGWHPQISLLAGVSRMLSTLP
jgi:nucleoside-diphosphate-sugar epimerase